jgi:hypothetical protein
VLAVVLLAVIATTSVARPGAAAVVNATGSQSPATIRPLASHVPIFALDLMNTGVLVDTLTSLTFTNQTSGAGGQAEFDLEMGSLELRRDDGDQTFEVGQDPILATTTAAGGRIRFTGIHGAVPALGSARFYLAANPSILARDGDWLDVTIQASSDVQMRTAVIVNGTFPINPAGNFPIDGMSAAEIGLHVLPARPLIAGTDRNLVFDVTLPANGYRSDVLDRLEVVNRGTAQPGADVTALALYRDNGDGVCDPAADARVGVLASSGGGHWLITGLGENIPVGGARFFVCADLALFATDGRTVRLGLPVPPDVGVAMSSDDDGPNDLPVDQPNDLTISTANRVTLSSAPLVAVVARPGSTGAVVLDVIAKNDYTTARTVTRLRVTDATRGPGSITDLDREFQRVALRLDGDGNGVLGTLAQDPEVSAGLLSAGQLDFTGFAWSVPPGASRHAFVVADLSTAFAADGDSLSVLVGGPFDATFAESTIVAASWPIDSRARVAVDGMVAAQLHAIGSSSLTLGPGEGPALAGAFVIPPNGYLPDTLTSLRFTNLGSASPADLAELRLWRDGGDGAFGAGAGDDQDLGALTWNGGAWISAPLAMAVGSGGRRVWVSATVGATPTDSATVHVAVPIGGLTMSSGDDGPTDAPVDGARTLLISNAALIASLAIVPAQSVVGQQVSVRLAVRNRGAEAIVAITPTAITGSGAGTLAYRSGPVPGSMALTPAATDTFTWTYDAALAGSVQLSAGAGGTAQGSGQPRNALRVTSGSHAIFSPAGSIDVAIAQAMPVAVAWRQQGVVPLTLTFTDPGAAGSAPVEIDRVTVRIEDANGNGVVPSAILARASLESGGATVAIRDPVESSGSNVVLALATPLSISAGESAALALRFDVADSVATRSFRLSIADSTAFGAAETLTGRALTVRLGSGYPYRTSLARIVAPASRLEIDALAGNEVRAARGQRDVPILDLTLQSPGIAGVTSNVRLLSFGLAFTDAAGVTLPRVADVLGSVEVVSGGRVLAVRTVYAVDDSILIVALSPALDVPVNTGVPLALRGDLLASATPARVRARLADSTRVDARDADSGDPVPVGFLANPVAGPSLKIEAVADSLVARGAPRFGARTRIGDTGVTAIAATLRHPGAAGVGRVRVDSLVVLFRDDQHHDVAPASVTNRLFVRRDGVEIASLTTLPASGGRASIAIPSAMLEAGDSTAIEIAIDVAANAPSGFLELSIAAPGVVAVDANLSTAVNVGAESGSELPLVSGLTRLEAPARELRADFADRMPAALAADGRSVLGGVLTLRNTAAAGTDTIYVDRIRIRAADRDLGSLPVRAGAGSIEAWSGGTAWASSGAIVTDSTSALLVSASPLAVPAGATAALEIRFASPTSAGAAAFRLGLDSVGVQVRQPASALLHIDVRPEAGRAFPEWTQAGSFSGMTLASSISNYPNPFAAGREATRFVYFLRSDARVTLKLVTLAGDLVLTSLDRAPRVAGLRQDDGWDGKNGAGLVVRNGVYLAELVAEYADGGHERVTRKIAVVR